MYIKNGIEFNRYVDIECKTQIEQIWIEVKLKNVTAYLATIYRHIMSKIAKNIPVFVLGDFNVDQGCVAETPDSIVFIEIFTQFGFKQLINENTRITQTTATILDLIFTNRPELILSSSSNDIRICDHCLISAVLEIKKIKHISHGYEYRDMKNYNLDTLNSRM